MVQFFLDYKITGNNSRYQVKIKNSILLIRYKILILNINFKNETYKVIKDETYKIIED